MTLNFQHLTPGMQASRSSTEKRLVWGPVDWYVTDQVLLVSTTVDARSTATNELLPGLCLGQVTSSGKFIHYSATATDGSQEGLALLLYSVNMKDSTGTAQDQLATVLVAGAVKSAECGGLDVKFRADVFGRIFFDDYATIGGAGQYGWRDVVAKTADYTVTSADSGTVFTNRGAAGAVNFTLPTIAKGLRYRFYSEAAQTITITSTPADTLVTHNDLAADSIALSTANRQIGGSVEVFANDNASKWLSFPGTWNVADDGTTVTKFTIAT